MNNDLGDPCSSLQEDMPLDADSVGLDNDGDGTADWPADLDCAQPTTTTTVTTTTTTTLPVGCGPAPAGGCIAPEKGSLLVSETAPGKEKLKVSLKKLQATVAQGDFGNPLTGSTSYAICIYDDLNQLVVDYLVARAQDDCGSPPAPCFKAISTKGYKYNDKLSASEGISKLILSGGDLGKGKATVSGKNNSNQLPTGIAALLQSSTQATVQILTSDAACFGLTVTDVKKADGSVFSAATP